MKHIAISVLLLAAPARADDGDDIDDHPLANDVCTAAIFRDVGAMLYGVLHSS
jgi:hypothetical protein